MFINSTAIASFFFIVLWERFASSVIINSGLILFSGLLTPLPIFVVPNSLMFLLPSQLHFPAKFVVEAKFSAQIFPSPSLQFPLCSMSRHDDEAN